MKMKTFARKMLFTLIALMVFGTSANASHDTPITVDKLPRPAKLMITKFFNNKKVALATMETGLFEKTYEVIFTDGDKLKFDRIGNWKEIKRKAASVPTSLIPTQITAYIKEHYPNTKVMEIERDGRQYDVKLDNRLELTFNKKYQLIDIDN